MSGLPPEIQIADVPGQPALEAPALPRILEEISARGPITFARFMEIALYDPVVGYYAQAHAGPGIDDDYVTGPEVHPAFAVLLTSQVEEMWRQLGRPRPFWLVEGGPGTGRFAETVLASTEMAFPELASVLRIALVERSARLRWQQSRLLSGRWGGQVSWIDPDPKTWHSLGAGCVFANELLDAFPVHRVIMRRGRLHELYVRAHEGGLATRVGPLSTPRIAAQLRAGGAVLGEGHQAEVNLAAPEWVTAASRLVAPGYIVIVDYGEPATRLYGDEFPSGTVRAYWRQTMSRDVLARPGAQDLTAHVDFSAVIRAGSEAGLTPVGATRQARLLNRLGLAALFDELPRRLTARSEQVAHSRALAALADTHGLGNLIALGFATSGALPSLSGFSTPLACAPELLDTPCLWASRPIAPVRGPYAA